MKSFEDSLENRVNHLKQTPKKPISLAEIIEPIEDFTTNPKRPETDEEIRYSFNHGWEEPERFVTYKIEDYLELPVGDYILEGELIIPNHTKLKINPGTNIYLDKRGQITSYGTLEAIGTKKQPISFLNHFSNSSAMPTHIQGFTEKNWRNICFFGQHSKNSSLENCIIQGGKGISRSDYEYDSKENFSGFMKNHNCGGGVLLVDTDMKIKNCTFKENNIDHGDGGAIYAIDSKLLLINLKIINNHSDSSIVYGKDSRLIIKDCVMDKNSIKEIFGKSSVIKLENCESYIHSCQIANNLMGGIYSIASKTNLKDLEIYENTSTRQGTGIRSENSKISIRDSSIQSNETFSNKEYYQKYSGIEKYFYHQLNSLKYGGIKRYCYNTTYESLFFTFFNRIPRTIANFLVKKYNYNIFEKVFANIINVFNKGYKDKYLNQIADTVRYTYMEDSHKDETIYPGGGIYIENSNMVLRDSEINKNKAKGGAGIYIQDSSFEILSSKILYNKTKDSYKKIYLGHHQTGVDEVGGGIYIQNSDGKISNSEIKNNKAKDGGGIYIQNYTNEWHEGKKKAIIKEVTINDNNKITDNAPNNNYIINYTDGWYEGEKKVFIKKVTIDGNNKIIGNASNNTIKKLKENQ